MADQSKVDNIKFSDISLFKDLSKDEKAHVKKYLKVQIFKKGEVLFSEGNLCERIFIVKSGRVKTFRLSSSGKEQILEVLEPGETCACNPGTARWACSSSAQAITDGDLWVLSRFNYVQMLKSNSSLTRTLNNIFAERLCRFSSLIEGVSLDAPQKRLIKFILDMMDPRGPQPVKENCLCQAMTQEEIAQRLGLTRVTVARHLRQLKALKLISYQSRRIIILNKESLEKTLL